MSFKIEKNFQKKGTGRFYTPQKSGNKSSKLVGCYGKINPPHPPHPTLDNSCEKLE